MNRNLNRRDFFVMSAAGAAAAAGFQTRTAAAQDNAAELQSVKALTFDMGGTVFDWHHTVRDEVRLLATAKGISVDAADFANQWRRGFFGVLGRVRRGALEAKNADEMHRIALNELLEREGIDGLAEREKHELNLVWHRLRTWPDVKIGLERLRSKYIVSGFSILSFGILVDGSKRAGLNWDSLISCEFLGYYKPDPNSYKKAAELLGLKPSEVMMVAAHKSDLRAAMSAGFQAAYTPRPLEYGALDDRDLSPEADFAVNAKDFHELASLIA